MLLICSLLLAGVVRLAIESFPRRRTVREILHPRRSVVMWFRDLLAVRRRG